MNSQPNWDAKEKAMYHMNYYRTLCDFFKGGQLLPEDINIIAKNQVEDTWGTYHLETNLPSQKTMNEQARFNNTPKQKPSRCPKCGSMAYYNNKGVSNKSGHPIPWENNKCAKCKYIEWKSENYYSKAEKAHALKSMTEDAQREEVEQENIPVFDEYGNPI